MEGAVDDRSGKIEIMKNIRMEDVIFGDNYRLNILLSNGNRIIYDLKPKLVTARFRDISDRRVYTEGKMVDGKLIRWNKNTELSLGEILLNIKYTGKPGENGHPEIPAEYQSQG